MEKPIDVSVLNILFGLEGFYYLLSVCSHVKFIPFYLLPCFPISFLVLWILRLRKRKILPEEIFPKAHL